VRKNGQTVETSWDEALAVVTRRLQAAHTVAGLVSPRTTNESLAAFSRFFKAVLKSNKVALLHGEVPPMDLGTSATLQDVSTADCVVIVGGNPLADQKVVGYLTKRAFDHDARLIIVNDQATDLDSLAHQCLPLDDPAEIKAAVEGAARPVILYGAGLNNAVYALLRTLPAKTRFLPLVKGTNAIGAARLGLNACAVKAEALYVLAGDDRPNGHALPKAEFTVVQAAYRTSWTEAADVVLPAQVWTEKDGHIMNVEGRELTVKPSIKAPENILDDWATFEMLSHGLHSA
jgi:predicted molibdopterin-dependent oxidoreductase YjgC